MENRPATRKRVMLVGAKGSGKTTFCLRLQRAPFDFYFTRAAVDQFTMTKTFGHMNFDITIDDTAFDRIDGMGRLYAQFINDITLFCFAVNDQRSFEIAKEWFLEARVSPFHSFLVGMKADLRANPMVPRLVSRDEARLFVDTYGLRDYLECSSMPGAKVGPERVIASVIVATCNGPLTRSEKSYFDRVVCSL